MFRSLKKDLVTSVFNVIKVDKQFLICWYCVMFSQDANLKFSCQTFAKDG